MHLVNREYRNCATGNCAGDFYAFTGNAIPTVRSKRGLAAVCKQLRIINSGKFYLGSSRRGNCSRSNILNKLGFKKIILRF